MNKISDYLVFSNRTLILFLAFILSCLIVFSVFVLIHPTSSSNLKFADFASFFVSGNGWKLFKIDDRCVITPFLASWLVRFEFKPYTAVFLVGSAFYIFTLFPLFFLLRNFLNSTFSSIGCVMYAVTPSVVNCFNEIQVFERNLFVIASTLLLLSQKDKKNYFKLLLFGLCLGALVLIRPKSILFVAFFLFFYFFMCYKKERTRIFFNYLIIFLGFSVIIVPGVCQVYGYTGYPGLTLKQALLTKKIFSCFDEKQGIEKVKLKLNKEDKSIGYRDNRLKLKSDMNSNQKSKKKRHLLCDKKNINYNFAGVDEKNISDNYTVVFIGKLFKINIVYQVLLLLGILLIYKRRLWTTKHSILTFLVFLNIFICYKYHLEDIQYATLNTILFFPLIIFGLREHLLWFKEYKICRLKNFFLIIIAIVVIYFFSIAKIAF